MEVFLPERQILLELATGPIVQMDGSPLDGVVLEMKFPLLALILELPYTLGLRQVLFKIDSINKI